MTTDETLRIKRLQAAELHGAMPETPVIETIASFPYESGAMRFETGDVSVYVSAKRDFLIIRGSDCEDTQIEAGELATLIALLQRASAIMSGGE
jgi:hypothetical protein